MLIPNLRDYVLPAARGFSRCGHMALMFCASYMKEESLLIYAAMGKSDIALCPKASKHCHSNIAFSKIDKTGPRLKPSSKLSKPV